MKNVIRAKTDSKINETRKGKKRNRGEMNKEKKKQENQYITQIKATDETLYPKVETRLATDFEFGNSLL